jgi:hypothetical protein
VRGVRLLAPACVAGAVALAGCGGGGGPAPQPVTVTVAVPATAATTTATAGGRTVVTAAPAPAAAGAKTARRGAPVLTTGSAESGAASPSPPRQSYAFTGAGDTSLGTIRLSDPSVLRWTASGRFALTGAGSGGRTIAIASTAAHGEARLAAGTARDVAVRTSGRWTVVITPAP